MMFLIKRSCFALLLTILGAASLAQADDIRQVNATVDGMVYNSADGNLYASVSSGSNANSILPISPTTATSGIAVALGAVPKKMVISTDGHYIYTVLGDGTQIRRFDTTTQTAGLQWGLGTAYSALYAEDIAALPGSPASVVVSRSNRGISPRHQDVVIFDGNVIRNSPRPVSGATSIEVKETGTRVYGYYGEITSFNFVRWTLDNTGFTSVSPDIYPISGFNLDFKYAANRCYSSSGVAFDPESGDIFGQYSSMAMDMTVPDPGTGRLFTASQSGTTVTLRAQDLTTLAPLGTLNVPGVTGTAGQLVRWGTNGLAFRADNQVYLVRSALVNGTLPTFTSVTPNQGMWGTSVVITGQNFLTTSAVKFNGLDAIFQVDSDTQITATVPGNATTGPITVTTGGGSANTPTFTVLPYVPPTISVGDASAPENGGYLSIPITLSRTAGLAVTIDVATSNGTAIASQDYNAVSSTITIPAGSSSTTVNVPLINDSIKEPNETFTLTLSNVTNATLNDAQGVGTIINDDLPTLTVSNGSVAEGNSGTTNLDFTVTLSYASDDPVSFNFTTADGTATAGVDYVAQNGSRFLVPGQTTKTISIPIKGDTLDEVNKNFYLRLSNVVGAIPVTSLTRNIGNGHFYEAVNAYSTWDNAKISAESRTYLGVAGHLVTITSADEQTFINSKFGNFSFWLGGLQASGSTEPAGGFGWITGEPFYYTAWSSGEPNNVNNNEDAIQQNYNGSWRDAARASIGSGYVVEYDVPANAAGSGGEAVGTILDDDVVTLSINDVIVNENTGGTATATFTVSLSAASTQTIAVDFATADGTAVAPDDYTATSDSLAFAPGETTKTVSVPINSDTVTEGPETFSVNLLDPYNATVSDAQGIGTINDGIHPAPVNVSVSPSSGASNAGTARYLSAVYSDGDGYADISSANLLINTTLNPANALWGYYDAVANKLYLKNDAGTAFIGGFAPGSSNVISNAQGSLNCAASTIGRSGNNLTVNWNFTPATAFIGSKNLYAYVKDFSNKTDGWDDLGDLLVKGISNAAPVNTSLAPANSANIVNTARTFGAVYSDADGILDLTNVQLLINTSASPTAALWCYYDVPANKLYLKSADGSALVGGFAPGSANTITNPQGTLNCASTAIARNGNALTVYWNVTPTASFVGNKNLYMYVRDSAGATAGFTDMGDWLVKTSTNTVPVNVSVTPGVSSSGAGVAHSLTVTYSDGDGALDISNAQLLINTSVSPTNAIWGYYDSETNKLYLKNQQGTALIGGVTPGSNVVISNGEDTLNCAATTVTRSGNALTINWNFTPNASFTGTKNLYAYVKDTASATAGFNDLGDWTITSGAAPMIAPASKAPSGGNS